jgi:hypothetical protein
MDGGVLGHERHVGTRDDDQQRGDTEEDEEVASHR